MKMKHLLAICVAVFLVSCNKEDDPRHNLDIVGLNVKDAKYIYTSTSLTRSGSEEYRQIKKDGRDIALSWINSSGDTLAIESLRGIWDINDKYLMITLGQPLNYGPDSDGNLSPVLREGYSFLVDKKTEAIYEIGKGLNGENAVTDENGNIYASDGRNGTPSGFENYINILYKIHTQNPTNLKLEEYIRREGSSPMFNDLFVMNSKGVCFHNYRYIRPLSGTRQFIISDFILGAEYGAAFVSQHQEEMYIVGIGGDVNMPKLVVSKVNGTDVIECNRVAELPIDWYWSGGEAGFIRTKRNQWRNTTLICIDRRNTYEFNLAENTLAETPVKLEDFFTINSYTTADALYQKKSANKLDIISLKDYSTKTLDLGSEGIDFRYMYTMQGSNFLYFSGFSYSTSQSVIGTIDIDGNVHILESTPNPITSLVQIN